MKQLFLSRDENTNDTNILLPSEYRPGMVNGNKLSVLLKIRRNAELVT